VRDKQKEETHRRLYHAALEIFARDGVAECRIEDIAQKAEVSRAAFYFHFPAKEDVLRELLLECETEIVAELDALPADTKLKPLLHKLLDVTARTWTKASRDKLVVDAFAVSLRRPALFHDRESDIVRSALSKRFDACKGELSASLAPEMLADFYLLNMFAVMASWGADPKLELPAMLHGMTVLFMNGARGASATPFEL